MAALLFAPLNAVTFFAAIACVAFNFGGTITVFPSLVSEFFGLNNLAKNYGVIYLGFGIGSIFGSIIASLFGGFYVTFYVIFALLVDPRFLRRFVSQSRKCCVRRMAPFNAQPRATGLQLPCASNASTKCINNDS